MNKLILAIAVVACTLPVVTATASGGKGLTWQKYQHDVNTGTDLVGCSMTGINNCDPYVGDTSCQVALPVLCVKIDGSPNPGVPAGFYEGWKSGHIATTVPIAGTSLTSQQAADQYCAISFGSGWVMADYHHPQGAHNWRAYGNVRMDSRFWVRIRDQAANCWNP